MSATFEVDRGKSDERYCPYCNSCPLDGMTDEHVFPQSIGGDGRTVIRVCLRCNSRAGHTVDVFVSKHSWLRSLAFSSGNLMKRQEGHESIGVLKDGRRLTGRFFWIPVPSNNPEVEFDWVCPECQQMLEKEGTTPDLDKLKAICIHCVRLLRQEFDPNYS